jgi:hypothetical protein
MTDACCQNAQELSDQATCEGDNCCCKPMADDGGASGESVSSPVGIKGCSLLPTQLISLSAEQRVSRDLALAKSITIQQVELVNRAQTEVFIYPPTPRNRGATYLRCCVLLI